uniref:Uncharacterized protein n=1 Tax=Setaria digitata TaxID=48799 RepID=A0A915Q139_9BILA
MRHQFHIALRIDWQQQYFNLYPNLSSHVMPIFRATIFIIDWDFLEEEEAVRWKEAIRRQEAIHRKKSRREGAIYQEEAVC